MKKRITHPDGTIEELEGTPEEITEAERLLRLDGPRKKTDEGSIGNRRILNEDVV